MDHSGGGSHEGESDLARGGGAQRGAPMVPGRPAQLVQREKEGVNLGGGLDHSDGVGTAEAPRVAQWIGAPLHFANEVALGIAAAKAGITKRTTPHKFRHGFGTHLLERGTGSRTVQGLVGHAKVETTRIYLHTIKKLGLGLRSPLDG